MLLRIDAVNRVKKLKLTNCVNITGVGLEPLRGCIELQQIDLSLVEEHQSPKLVPEPPISCDYVLPILHSIIETKGCALKHIQFPRVWDQDHLWIESNMFVTRYNQMWRNRGAISCFKCDVVLEAGGHLCTRRSYFGTQDNTCCVC